MQIEASDTEVVYNRSQGKAYNLLVTPLGKEIPSETKAFFEKYASKYVKEMVYKVTDNFNIDQLNVVGKYLSEMTGVVTATVNGEIIKNTSVRMDPNDIIITIQLDEKVTVDISLMQLKDDLFEFIFNNLFANFPYSPSGKKLATPAMPPYYSS